jgi:hypothetical protein
VYNFAYFFLRVIMTRIKIVTTKLVFSRLQKLCNIIVLSLVCINYCTSTVSGTLQTKRRALGTRLHVVRALTGSLLNTALRWYFWSSQRNSSGLQRSHLGLKLHKNTFEWLPKYYMNAAKLPTITFQVTELRNAS